MLATARIKEKAMKSCFYMALVAGGLMSAPAFGFGGGGIMGPDFDFAAADRSADGLLSKDELAAVRKAHVAAMDADGDGKITLDEMTAHMEAEQADRIARKARHMMAELDASGDGAISAAEMEMGQRSDRMFARIDGNGDGQISAEELAKAREKMGDRLRRHGG